VENISGSMLSNVSLYGMAAPHPANTEYAGTSGAYDWTLHSTGGFEDYFWDVTAQATNSGLTDGFATGSQFDDAVTYSINILAGAWDIDTYKGHQFGDDGLPSDPQDAIDHGLKPLVGSHCNIENMSLNNQNLLTGQEISAGFQLDAATLGAGTTWSGDVLLAVDSKTSSRPAPVCARIIETGGQPTLLFHKGACGAPNATALTYDVAMGSTFELFRVQACGTGPKGSFDCSALTNLVCKAKGHGLDRIALNDDSPVTDLLYYVARPSGTFSSWGEGNNGPNPADLLRFYFTSQTAPGIDVCDLGALSRSTAPAPDTPGIGRLEEAGGGARVPGRETLLP